MYIFIYIYIYIQVNGKQRKNYKFAVTLSFTLSNLQTAFIYREMLLQVFHKALLFYKKLSIVLLIILFN